MCDYYAAVMGVFKADRHSRFVVRSGMFALKFAAPNSNVLVS